MNPARVKSERVYTDHTGKPFYSNNNIRKSMPALNRNPTTNRGHED